MRAFVGIPIPETWIPPLMRASGRLPGGRSVEADDLHVTLAFLDDQPEDRLEALHEALEIRPLPSARLRPLSFAPFGSRPSLVALDLAPDPDLGALRDAVRTAARVAGIDLPRERFRPHVTLRRFPKSHPPSPRLSAALAGLGVPDMEPAPAALVTLWSSTLGPGGPLYEPLASYPLAVRIV